MYMYYENIQLIYYKMVYQSYYTYKPKCARKNGQKLTILEKAISFVVSSKLVLICVWTIN